MTDQPVDTEQAPILEARDLAVTFDVRRKNHRSVVRAVRGVSFDLMPRRTMGLVGESGSGKSTLARALLRLIPSEGEVRLRGADITSLKGRPFREAARQVQMVFQDPYSSLNPSLTIGASIEEPLLFHSQLNKRERRERVEEVLSLVGLAPDFADRYPSDASGGQRQRVAIARAIALRPDVIVCDEAVSALDVSTQNQVITLLESLRDKIGLSYLFISHDLAVVRHISDDVAVMYLGEVIEQGPVDRVFDRAAHPYTEILKSAVPVPDPVVQRAKRKVLLRGDVPDPGSPPAGCAFHPRCPIAMEICRTTVPPKVEIPGGGFARCHVHTTGPALNGAPVAAAMGAAAPAATTEESNIEIEARA